MNNADLFKKIFGIYAEEFWSFPCDKMLDWLNVTDTNVGDLISRQILMKEFSEFVKKSNNSDFARTPTWNDAVSLVGSTPTLEPERKKGKWVNKKVIPINENGFELQSCKCSVCGRYHTSPYMYYFDEPNFCSWCGADMKEGEQ